MLTEINDCCEVKFDDESYMFVSGRERRFTDQNIRRLFYRVLQDAGIPRMQFHALRHTFATRCIESGFDVKSLSEILGHADATMTLNTYTHALEEQKRNNMDKLSDLYQRKDEK